MKLKENILNNEETYCEDCLEMKTDSEFDLRFDFPICFTCSENENDTDKIYSVWISNQLGEENAFYLDRKEALDLFDELLEEYPGEDLTITRKGK
jgi:hypothetical protein